MTDQDSQEPASAAASELRSLVSRLLRQMRRTDGLGDLTGSQKNALSRLERHGPATVSELARAEGVRSQSMGATVSSLEAAGLILRTPSTTDRRKTLLALTSRAKTLYTEGRSLRQDWLRTSLSREFSPDELAQIRQTVALLTRIVPVD